MNSVAPLWNLSYDKQLEVFRGMYFAQSVSLIELSISFSVCIGKSCLPLTCQAVRVRWLCVAAMKDKNIHGSS